MGFWGPRAWNNPQALGPCEDFILTSANRSCQYTTGATLVILLLCISARRSEATLKTKCLTSRAFLLASYLFMLLIDSNSKFSIPPRKKTGYSSTIHARSRKWLAKLPNKKFWMSNCQDFGGIAHSSHSFPPIQLYFSVDLIFHCFGVWWVDLGFPANGIIPS